MTESVIGCKQLRKLSQACMYVFHFCSRTFYAVLIFYFIRFDAADKEEDFEEAVKKVKGDE